MELKSPCLRCKRKDESKTQCVKKCPAIKEYNAMRDHDLEEIQAMEITGELDELAKNHADKHTDKIEPTAKGSIIEKIKVPTMSKRDKRGKYKKKAQTNPGQEKADPGTGQTKINPGQSDDIIVLDLSEYQQIDKYLTEYSDKMMLPKEHIIMSLIGEALRAKINRSKVKDE